MNSHESTNIGLVREREDNDEETQAKFLKEDNDGDGETVEEPTPAVSATDVFSTGVVPPAMSATDVFSTGVVPPAVSATDVFSTGVVSPAVSATDVFSTGVVPPAEGTTSVAETANIPVLISRELIRDSTRSMFKSAFNQFIYTDLFEQKKMVIPSIEPGKIYSGKTVKSYLPVLKTPSFRNYLTNSYKDTHNDSREHCMLLNFPLEILAIITSFLTFKELINLMKTSLKAFCLIRYYNFVALKLNLFDMPLWKLFLRNISGSEVEVLRSIDDLDNGLNNISVMVIPKNVWALSQMKHLIIDTSEYYKTILDVSVKSSFKSTLINDMLMMLCGRKFIIPFKEPFCFSFTKLTKVTIRHHSAINVIPRYQSIEELEIENCTSAFANNFLALMTKLKSFTLRYPSIEAKKFLYIYPPSLKFLNGSYRTFDNIPLGIIELSIHVTSFMNNADKVWLECGILKLTKLRSLTIFFDYKHNQAHINLPKIVIDSNSLTSLFFVIGTPHYRAHVDWWEVSIFENIMCPNLKSFKYEDREPSLLIPDIIKRLSALTKFLSCYSELNDLSVHALTVHEEYYIDLRQNDIVINLIDTTSDFSIFTKKKSFVIHHMKYPHIVDLIPKDTTEQLSIIKHRVKEIVIAGYAKLTNLFIRYDHSKRKIMIDAPALQHLSIFRDEGENTHNVLNTVNTTLTNVGTLKSLTVGNQPFKLNHISTEIFEVVGDTGGEGNIPPIGYRKLILNNACPRITFCHNSNKKSEVKTLVVKNYMKKATYDQQINFPHLDMLIMDDTSSHFMKNIIRPESCTTHFIDS